MRPRNRTVPADNSTSLCDRNGDMVADLPTDPKNIINPSTLIFSYMAVEEPAVYQRVWDGFLKHMAAATGKKVLYYPTQSYALQYEAMRSGRVHVAAVNTGGYPIAVNCAGFVPFATMASKDGTYGYEMELIVPADSSMKTPADLKGKTIAFVAPTSNSGYKAPLVILKSEFGLEVERDFKPAFSGKHDNSVLGVVNKDYEAAAVANEIMRRMFGRGVADPAKLRTIYKSQTFPLSGFGHVYNLEPKLAEKIKQAFFTFPWEGSALKAEYKEDDQFIPNDYRKDWGLIRKIDEALGVKYTCK